MPWTAGNALQSCKCEIASIHKIGSGTNWIKFLTTLRDPSNDSNILTNILFPNISFFWQQLKFCSLSHLKNPARVNCRVKIMLEFCWFCYLRSPTKFQTPTIINSGRSRVPVGGGVYKVIIVSNPIRLRLGCGWVVLSGGFLTIDSGCIEALFLVWVLTIC